MLRPIALLFLAALAGSPAPNCRAEATTPVINNRRELFTDDYLLDQFQGLDVRLCTPVSGGKAIVFDQPWEGRFALAGSVVNDGSLFRMYYRGLAGLSETTQRCTCYAESKDGIHWTRPVLNQETFQGSTQNNIIKDAPDVVIYDDKPGVPYNQKFKALRGGTKTGLYVVVSADGFKWKRLNDDPAVDGAGKGHALDSPNVLAWVPAENQYAIYMRAWTGDTPGVTPKEPNEFGNINPFYHGIRTLQRSTSTDLIHWSAPARMDFGDTPLEHFYTNATQAYFRAPHILIAMPMRYNPDWASNVLTEAELKAAGIHPVQWRGNSDAVLLTSRGGNHFDRKFPESFVRPGPSQQNWGARSQIPALGIIPTGPAEISFFVNRGYATENAFVERMTLRTDGFASIHAGFKAGTATTKTLVLEGNEMLLNFATSPAGYVKVLVLDDADRELPGFGEAEAPSLRGDHIDGRVTWKSGKTIRDIRGRRVKIRFEAKDADIYSVGAFD